MVSHVIYDAWMHAQASECQWTSIPVLQDAQHQFHEPEMLQMILMPCHSLQYHQVYITCSTGSTDLLPSTAAMIFKIHLCWPSCSFTCRKQVWKEPFSLCSLSSHYVILFTQLDKVLDPMPAFSFHIFKYTPTSDKSDATATNNNSGSYKSSASSHFSGQLFGPI